MYPELDKPHLKRLRDGLTGALVMLALVFCLAPTTNGGALTVVGEQCTIDLSSKDMVCILPYSVTSSGRPLDRRVMYVPGNNGAITDVTGAQVAASVPSAISTGRDSMVTGITGSIATAAGAGKLDR